ncbi:zinc finger and SCAN domain-containing protein 2-like isoform X2 [Conger conger]|uniref:zinc finger and SCAN domain-containing protein 2-like isoform X2 n=1 Tax=Conger conger TaxID=82655 RepID=UPI002A5A0776|nr:zinc finger and SCAN domain-containing protein 2-like isoform X2 [Conger conger]
MSICAFKVQVASIMEVLAKTAVAEITELINYGSAVLRREMCRSERENEALKTKLLLVEGELRDVRGNEEGTPGISLNLSFQVQLCDEFREAQRPNVPGNGRISSAEMVLSERLRTHPARDDQNVHVEKIEDRPVALDIKREPVDGEQDWSESLPLSEDRLEEDPTSSQSQAEQKISTSGAAAANGGEGPLCKEEELHMPLCSAGDPEKELQAELKQEPEEQPLTPTLPLSVDLGLELQSVWSEATSSGTIPEKQRRRRRCSTLRDAQLDDTTSPKRYRGSRRLRSEKDEGSASYLEQKQNGHPLYKECSNGPPDDFSQEMSFLLGSPGECDGSAPCEASSDTSTGTKSPCRTEGQEEEFVCTRCGKTFPDALELKTHEQVHSRKKPFSCSVCDKSFSQSHILKAHESTHTGQKPYACVECGKCFSLKSHLKTHQVTHTGERLFSCTVCDKSFAQLGVLKQHQRIHTGEKPHCCNKCGKSFTQLGTSGAAAANSGEGPLCKEEELHMQPCPAGAPEKELKAELKQEPEEHPLTPTLPLLESRDLGLELQAVWSEANSLEISQNKNRPGARTLEHGDTSLDDNFSPPHGSAPCAASSDTSAEAKSPYRTEGQEEEFICTRCGKTFLDALELKTHEVQHSAGKRFSCSECGK